MKKNIYFLILLFFSCDNPLTNNESQNCVLDLGGFFDDCGVCSGGITNHIPNSSKDCYGECFGLGELDQCGVCNGDNSSCESSDDGFCDLDNGEFWDDCGYCIGTNDIENEFMDDCGYCHKGQSEFDQYENHEMDLCGTCYGEDIACNYGLLTLSPWQFTQIKLWNNDSCYGNPYYVMDDYICLENGGSCFSYSLVFEADYEYGILVFTQTIQFTNGTQVELDGQWWFDGEQLCLDYNNGEYEDGCYDTINIQHTYNDCVSNLSLCENNIISFSSVNENEGSCSKEIFNKLSDNIPSNQSITSEMYPYFPFYITNAFIYIDNYLNQ